MKIVIVGCGRVGSVLAESYDAAGHEVIVLDLSTRAFDRLPGEFRGSAVRGDGTDEDTLRRAGAEGADAFLALTEGDNRNVMAAQVATEKLEIGQVLAKINDPVRAAAYAELGIATVCRTTMLADAVSGFLGLPSSGIPSLIEARGSHHGGPAHEPLASGAGGGGAATAATAEIAAASTGRGAGREG
ncbi:MAG: TrkA family potassium uptake protein [Chloroflexi bacterium]|nr:TrkA family potassium uptake protein [Chloroflexota bacterium]